MPPSTLALAVSTAIFSSLAVGQVAAASPPCKGCTCTLGYFCGAGQVTMPKRCVTHQGRRRCFHVHEPKGLGRKRLPLVVDLHGYGVHVYTNPISYILHGGGHYDISGWRKIAKNREFIAVYPIGRGVVPRWNAGTCCGGAADDDAGFIRKVITNMKHNFKVDGDRVYLTGHSNGCALAQRVTLASSDLVAGTACFAMYRLGGYQAPDSFSARSVYEIHGTADDVIAYSNYGAWPHGAHENLEAWGDLYSCTATEEVDLGGDKAARARTGCSGGAEVKLLTLPGVGHFPYKGHGTNFDTTASAWEFLAPLRLSGYSNPAPAPAPPSTPPDVGECPECQVASTACFDDQTCEQLVLSIMAAERPPNESELSGNVLLSAMWDCYQTNCPDDDDVIPCLKENCESVFNACTANTCAVEMGAAMALETPLTPEFVAAQSVEFQKLHACYLAKCEITVLVPLAPATTSTAEPPVCVDDGAWRMSRTGKKAKRGCAWVASSKNRQKQCEQAGARSACPLTCGGC